MPGHVPTWGPPTLHKVASMDWSDSQEAGCKIYLQVPFFLHVLTQTNTHTYTHTHTHTHTHNHVYMHAVSQPSFVL